MAYNEDIKELFEQANGHADDFMAERDQRRKSAVKAAAIWIPITACMIFGLLLLIVDSDHTDRRPPVHTTDSFYTVQSAGQTALTTETTLYYGVVTDFPSTVASLPPSQSFTAKTTATQTVQTTAPPITSANGSLLIDSSADNKFIQTVNREKGIPVSLLTAIYAVPDSGQNYVMEWDGTTDAAGKVLRNADTVRRCYLIDTEGKITDVAASKSGERVGMSAAENRVAMETLIKRVLIPQITDALEKDGQ